MVKVGFICEGETETIILNHSNFDDFLASFNIEKVGRAIKSGDDDKEGGIGNMKPNHPKVIRNVNALLEQEAEYIFFIRDLENLPCIISAKDEIHSIPNGVKVISVKAFDAFFLADTETLTKLLGQDYQLDEKPESFEKPISKLREIFIERRGINRGIGDKKKIARLFAENGFSFSNAAKNSESAKYFIKKLESLNQ